MLLSRLLRLVLLLTCLTTALRAQDTPDSGGGQLRVFLDCNFCDFDFVRAESPWISYVRDRTVADVHVLVTRLGTGAGGSAYTVNFAGQGAYAALSDTLRYVTRPGSTDDAVRRGLTNTIQLGLVRFVARTPQGAGLRLTYDAAIQQEATSPVDDPWNAWVFSLSARSSFERESRQNQLSLDGSANARRITDAWKFGVSTSGSFDSERFELDDGIVSSTRESYRGGAVLVKSIGPHWGAGAQTSVSSSTYDNITLGVRAAPAIEYSFWPYSIATQRQLTMQYSLGVSSFKYREETIFDRISETRPTQVLVVGYDVEQPWGSADAELQAASFLDDFQQNRVEFRGSMNVRVARGFQVEFGGRASLIRDQLSIVKRDATPEEILLQRRALQTDYRYSGSVGLRYTFGSIFNSIVNPRFGSGPGNVLH